MALGAPAATFHLCAFSSISWRVNLIHFLPSPSSQFKICDHLGRDSGLLSLGQVATLKMMGNGLVLNMVEFPL